MSVTLFQGHEPVASAEGLRAFRSALYRLLSGWGDALFELCDAALCAPAPVASVPALSLEPIFRRSHGSLYKALANGRVDADAMRDLLAAHRPRDWPLVFAVDASTWDRCDAETSPERGFYYSASKHSAGQPIVAGWSYQWVTGLDWAPDSWTAPLDAIRRQGLVIAAYTQLRLARSLVDDLRLPWERPRDPAKLTPARVRRGFRRLQPTLGTPASAPKSDTPGPGRPKHTRRPPRTRYPAVKKAA